VDKATKLEKVYDRIEDVKTRFEMLKREYHQALENAERRTSGSSLEDVDRELKALDEEYQFLVNVNNGHEFIHDLTIERIKRIAERKWSTATQTLPLLTEDEIYNLSVRRGTLNDEERKIINNHAAVTFKLLSKLPFPRKMKRIAEYAAAHHEKPDGSGYPLGLKGDALPLQSRVIALADIFEALTAKDRPYKKGKTVGEALKIIGEMVGEQHIDGRLYDLFIAQKIYRGYALSELMPAQRDVE